MKEGSEDPFSAPFTGSITAKIGGSIMAIIDNGCKIALALGKQGTIGSDHVGVGYAMGKGRRLGKRWR
ncbi:MAG: hypothetical protein AB2L12_18165 [Smithellaceae bacterium]